MSEQVVLTVLHAIRRFRSSMDKSLDPWKSNPFIDALHPFRGRKGPHLGPSLHGILLQSMDFRLMSVE